MVGTLRVGVDGGACELVLKVEELVSKVGKAWTGAEILRVGIDVDDARFVALGGTSTATELCERDNVLILEVRIVDPPLAELRLVLREALETDRGLTRLEVDDPRAELRREKRVELSEGAPGGI